MKKLVRKTLDGPKPWVLLKHVHNRAILNADLLKRRRPSEEIKQQFLRPFEASKALFAFESHLRNL